jgi:Williams-Beuren syndrome DDT (WSD), D-TOX E motif
LKPPEGFFDLFRVNDDFAIGAKDMEDDFMVGDNRISRVPFALFSRREYHSSGSVPALVHCRWGCHATEESLKSVMKQLDSRGIRERGLKNRLKESIEQTLGSSEKVDTIEQGSTEEENQTHEHHEDGDNKDLIQISGDEQPFLEAKQSMDTKDDGVSDNGPNHDSGIGAQVRVRMVLKESKNAEMARYENGTVTGWKMHRQKVADITFEADSDLTTQLHTTNEVPLWRVQTERGHSSWISGYDLLRSIARHHKWMQGHGYFEHDAAFFAYRNNLGRHCGKSSEAPYSSSAYVFAKLMMKREAELYPKLKARSYDNTWGGQSGTRALWTNSMKDYAYDFQTVRDGLLTLENAFFELTGKFNENGNVQDCDSIDGNALLKDASSLAEVELESIEKGLGLWNSPSSRAVFHAIVKDSKTTGVLALALDLLVRNTTKFLQTHKLLSVRSSRSSAEVASLSSHDISSRPVRSTRRMNAWQQQQQNEDEDGAGNDDDYSDDDWK